MRKFVKINKRVKQSVVSAQYNPYFVGNITSSDESPRKEIFDETNDVFKSPKNFPNFGNKVD